MNLIWIILQIYGHCNGKKQKETKRMYTKSIWKEKMHANQMLLAQIDVVWREIVKWSMKIER